MTYQPDSNRNNTPYGRNRNRTWMIVGVVAVLLVAALLFSWNRDGDMNELAPAAGQDTIMTMPGGSGAPTNDNSAVPPAP